MEIFAKGKTIPTFSFGNLFTQGEHFADTIDFIVDRYYCGKDLSLCSFVLRGVTEENWEIEQVLIPLVSERTLRLSWHVSDSFTHNAGRLALELRASETVDESNYTIIKYDMAPVTVRATIAGQNGPLPETAEQLISEINEAASAGVSSINDAAAADLDLLQQKMDDFDLEEVEARLDQMEEDTQTYLARPEVVALTREQYEAITPKHNSLYVIIRGGE